MAVGYLVTVLLAAIPTFFAVFAPHPTRTVARISFRLGVVINEAPLYPLAWVVFWSVTTGVGGAFGNAANLPALVIAALTAVGLVAIARRGFAAPAALADAGEQEPRLTLARAVLALLAPVVGGRSRAVRRKRNLSYGPAGRHNLLDLYLPRTAEASAGVLVHFHGGAFRSGIKSRESRLLLYRFASRGWVCASANYRLQPAVTFDEQVADAQAAIRWTRDFAVQQGADPARLILVGSSAGAYLSASVVAAGLNDPVEAVVGLSGFYGHNPSDPEGLAATLAARNDTSAPSFFLIHGSRDTYVDEPFARAFANALRAGVDAPVRYAELPGAQHSFDLMRSPRFLAVVDAVESADAVTRC